MRFQIFFQIVSTVALHRKNMPYRCAVFNNWQLDIRVPNFRKIPVSNFTAIMIPLF